MFRYRDNKKQQHVWEGNQHSPCAATVSLQPRLLFIIPAHNPNNPNNHNNHNNPNTPYSPYLSGSTKPHWFSLYYDKDLTCKGKEDLPEDKILKFSPSEVTSIKLRGKTPQATVADADRGTNNPNNPTITLKP